MPPSVETVTAWGQFTGATPPEQANETVTFELFQPAPFAGGVGVAESVSFGAVKVTGSERDTAFPAASIAERITVFAPGASLTSHVKFCCVSVAGAPLQVRSVMPESPSVAVPVSVNCAEVTVAPAFGDVTASTGAVLSIFSATEAGTDAPEVSVAVREMVWFPPSVDTVTGCGQVTVPAPPAQVNVTVTFVLFQPAAFGGGAGVADMVRADPSVTDRATVATFPAVSVARTVIAFGPFASVTAQVKFVPLTTAAALLQVTEARPERRSCAEPVIVNCGFVTAAAAAGEVTVSAGGVLSIRNVTDVDAVVPKASVAVREIS